MRRRQKKRKTRKGGWVGDDFCMNIMMYGNMLGNKAAEEEMRR